MNKPTLIQIRPEERGHLRGKQIKRLLERTQRGSFSRMLAPKPAPYWRSIAAPFLLVGFLVVVLLRDFWQERGHNE